MNIETRTHTALHIVKGAIAKTLGAKWTSSVWVEGNHGRIAVQYDRKPSNEELEEIQILTNKKIDENAPIDVINIDRKDAEKRWGDLIYDLFPLPEHITELTVFNLPGWNVNACNKDHTSTTGEIGNVVITKTRYRNNKRLLEVSFELVE
jgi:alanyl-tRNA synthetase